MIPTLQQITVFQEKILAFYREKGRVLPWRQTTDPYRILVSEVMLQQTQVDRVIPFYERWIQQWPSVEDLAKAERSHALEMWMGLGYNNRAVNLHNASNHIVQHFQGDIRKALDLDIKIPGIGPYTERAVRIFAFNADVVTVDTNIRRIFIHEFGLDPAISDTDLWALAEQCLPHGHSRDWHNALMDYGALFLTSRKTGIKPKTRQSKFEGSDRQIRAKMLRHLLTHQKESFSIQQLLEIVECSDAQRMQTILEGMIKDDLLVLEENRYALKLSLSPR